MTAFHGTNLMKFGPLLGDRLARSVLDGAIHPDLTPSAADERRHVGHARPRRSRPTTGMCASRSPSASLVAALAVPRRGARAETRSSSSASPGSTARSAPTCARTPTSRSTRRSALPDTEVVVAAPGELDEALDALNANPDVVYAEPDLPVTPQSNDPQFPTSGACTTRARPSGRSARPTPTSTRPRRGRRPRGRGDGRGRRHGRRGRRTPTSPASGPATRASAAAARRPTASTTTATATSTTGRAGTSSTTTTRRTRRATSTARTSPARSRR